MFPITPESLGILPIVIGVSINTLKHLVHTRYGPKAAQSVEDKLTKGDVEPHVGQTIGELTDEDVRNTLRSLPNTYRGADNTINALIDTD